VLAVRSRPTAHPVTKRCETMASLYDRMGGEEKIRALCNDLYAMHSTDALTKAWFGKGAAGTSGRAVPELVNALFTFFSAGIGGPHAYEGADMKKAHATMVIPENVFHSLVAHVMTGMEKHKTGGAAEREEVLGIMFSLKPDVMEGTKSQAKTETPAPTATLYDRMGGEEKIRPLCAALYQMHSTDPLTASYFGTGAAGTSGRPVDQLVNALFTFFSAGIGGPHKYEGADMRKAHMDMKIAGPAFHALVFHVMKGMEQHKTGGAAEREGV